MKKYVDGVLVDMTAEDINQHNELLNSNIPLNKNKQKENKKLQSSG